MYFLDQILCLFSFHWWILLNFCDLLSDFFLTRPMDICRCTVHMFVFNFFLLFSLFSYFLNNDVNAEVQFLCHIQNVDQKLSLLLEVITSFLSFFPHRYMRAWFSVGVYLSLIALVSISLVSWCPMIIPMFSICYVLPSWKMFVCIMDPNIPWCYLLLLLKQL